MKQFIFLFVLLIFYSLSVNFAQLTVKDQDSTPNTLLEINDEGNAGSITLPPLSSIGTSANKLYNIGNSLYWHGTALGTAGSAGGWTDDGSIVRLSNGSDKVGIGTASPATNLHVMGGMRVAGTVGAIFAGEFGAGTTWNIGSGTVMLWNPKKAAFRVGQVDGTQWDDANTGGHSISAGYNTKAIGDVSSSFGSFTTSESFASFAIGYNNIGGGSRYSWIETDPLFEIGNGITMTPSNAMTVLKNGNVGIGIHNPSYKLDISGGNFLVRGDNGFTAAGHTGTVYLGSVHHYIKGEYGFGLKLGTYVAGDVISVREVSGNVGINTTTPSAKFEVNGDVKIGANGIKFSEIIEVTGTTGTNRTDIPYPTGYTKTNTRIISYQVEDNLIPPGIWVSGYQGLWVGLEESGIKLGHEANIFNGQPYRLMLIKIE